MINDLNSINEQLKNENKLLKKKNYNSNDLSKEIGKLKKIIEANTQSYEENQKTLGEKLIQLEEENQKLKKFENQTNLYKKENKELKEKLEEYNKNLIKLLESNNKLEEDKQDNKVLKKKFNFEQLEKEIKELKEKIKTKNQNINTIKFAILSFLSSNFVFFICNAFHVEWNDWFIFFLYCINDTIATVIRNDVNFIWQTLSNSK